ncbi:hypothetical protein [Streptomyces caatingaensis]|uniref:Uncharacterized protein n=1 Tax=Streptomyces caatingaensis TaxID=1678637 RepID=A0A0K9XHZ4_9ACTN|nr:hypothetical protein [Streptomyces caatingaensis]KNB52913.1 hypothetical protein AC230_09820 [Streptomyces caatingaensis]
MSDAADGRPGLLDLEGHARGIGRRLALAGRFAAARLLEGVGDLPRERWREIAVSSPQWPYAHDPHLTAVLLEKAGLSPRPSALSHTAGLLGRALDAMPVTPGRARELAVSLRDMARRTGGG